jgi:uncharacterized protein (DUF305 family)
MPIIRTFLPDARHTRPATRRLAATAAAAALAFTLAACGNSSTTNSASQDGHSTDPSTAAAPSSGTQQHNAADVTFAQSMIPHHQQAVEMAKMSATQAASPAVKQLAAQIQAAQDPEINTMTGWLNAWGQPTSMSGLTGHSMDSMPGMMSDADMIKLGTLSGSAFDREFLTMMTAHHTGAIEMARTELAQGQYGPAKELADRIIADQTAEIAKMKTLLTQV